MSHDLGGLQGVSEQAVEDGYLRSQDGHPLRQGFNEVPSSLESFSSLDVFGFLMSRTYYSSGKQSCVD